MADSLPSLIFLHQLNTVSDEQSSLKAFCYISNVSVEETKCKQNSPNGIPHFGKSVGEIISDDKMK